MLFWRIHLIIEEKRKDGREMAKNDAPRTMALGGMLAALAVVVMALGGMIPLATYVCPMLCMLLLQVVQQLCGRRVGWAWYAAVAILSLLLSPDKEGAAVFVFLGYYPLVKPLLDKTKLRWLWKLLLFNGATVIMYQLLLHLFGMAQIAEEFAEMGYVMLGVTLLMGNFTFVLTDKILEKNLLRRRRGK